MSENISASMVPKVSIVIPIYNVAQFLVECLDSVVNQTLKEIEIICVNDGSTDSSLEIVKRYAAKDDRFVIINKKNAGYGHTMNRGIEKARGKYIGITESDDYIMPRMYEQLYTIAEKHHLDVVKSDYYEFNTISGRKNLDYIKTCNMDTSYYNHPIVNSKEHILFHFKMNTWTGIYRTEFLRENNICHNETPGASYQDNGFWFQTLSLAKSVYFLNKAFYCYRQDNPNSSINSNSKVYAMNDEYVFIEKFAEKQPPELKSKLLVPFAEKRLFNYRDMLKRLSENFRLDFLRRCSEDFWNMDTKKLIPYGDLQEWTRSQICRIMDDYEEYYYSEKLWKKKEYLEKLKKTLNEIRYSSEFQKGNRIRERVKKN